MQIFLGSQRTMLGLQFTAVEDIPKVSSQAQDVPAVCTDQLFRPTSSSFFFFFFCTMWGFHYHAGPCGQRGTAAVDCRRGSQRVCHVQDTATCLPQAAADAACKAPCRERGTDLVYFYSYQIHARRTLYRKRSQRLCLTTCARTPLRAP